MAQMTTGERWSCQQCGLLCNLREKHRGQKYAASLLITSVQVVLMSYDQHLARLRFKFVVCFEVLIMWVHTRINTIFSCLL